MQTPPVPAKRVPVEQMDSFLEPFVATQPTTQTPIIATKSMGFVVNGEQRQPSSKQDVSEDQERRDRSARQAKGFGGGLSRVKTSDALKMMLFPQKTFDKAVKDPQAAIQAAKKALRPVPRTPRSESQGQAVSESDMVLRAPSYTSPQAASHAPARAHHADKSKHTSKAAHSATSKTIGGSNALAHHGAKVAHELAAHHAKLAGHHELSNHHSTMASHHGDIYRAMAGLHDRHAQFHQMNPHAKGEAKNESVEAKELIPFVDMDRLLEPFVEDPVQKEDVSAVALQASKHASSIRTSAAQARAQKLHLKAAYDAHKAGKKDLAQKHRDHAASHGTQMALMKNKGL